MSMLDVARRAARLLRGMKRRCLPTRLDRIQAVHGWTREVQLRYLMRLVRALPDGAVIVELGVWQGRSVFAMAEACRRTSKRVFAIDPWVDYDEGGGPVSGYLAQYGVRSFEEVYQAFVAHSRRLGLERWIVTVRAPAADAARTWRHGPVSLVFIDASHHYDAVTSDLEAWVPLVRPGGVVCGDDWEWDSVRRAVQDFVTKYPGRVIDLPCANTWAFVVPSR